MIFNRYGIEKQALNAMNARLMAKEVGLFPTGNWKWGLRQLRDGRGNLLTGKPLADAKTKMGAVTNNGYQKIKQYESKKALGHDLQMGDGGTEVGGFLTDKGEPFHARVGERGEGGVGFTNDEIFENKRMFHTHPSNGRIKTQGQVKAQIPMAAERIRDTSAAYDEAGIDPLSPYETHHGYTSTDERQDAGSLLPNLFFGRQALRENASRFTGKRNPLQVDMSGRQATGLLAETGGDKNKINSWLKGFNRDAKHYNDVTDRLHQYVATGGRDEQLINDQLKQEGPAMRTALRKNQMLSQFRHPGDFSGGDYTAERARTTARKGDVLHNILAPTQDFEGIHKVHPDGRVRSTYLDRRPREVRRQEADEMRQKLFPVQNHLS